MDSTADIPLQAADAPAAAAAPTLLAISQARLAELNHFLQGAQNPTPDFVHDLRVITRRVTEAARLIAALMEKTAAAALTDSLRTLRQSTGDLRDLDVLADHLHSARLPAALHAVRDAILADLPACRAAHLATLERELASPTLSASLLFMARVLEESAAPSALTQDTLHRALNKATRKRRRQLKKELGKAAMKQTQHQFHIARIAVKKLRYSLELADESALGAHKKELKFLKSFQSHLGDMHDADVIHHTLRQHTASHSLSQQSLKSAKAFQKSSAQSQARRAAKALILGVRWMNWDLSGTPS